MDDYALVLNAGSSSLKFCVYQRPAGEPGGSRRAARSKASAPRRGSRPRTTPATRARRRARWTPTVRDGRAALDALAAWLRSRYGGARVLGVGHRVVHGGARFTGADASSRPRCSTNCATLVPLAPLHQPHNLAAIEAVVGAAAGRAAGRLLRHQLPSRAAGRRRARAAAARDPRAPACSATASTACRTSTSRRCCRRSRRRSPTAASIVAHLGSGASLCAMKQPARASTARSASPRSTASAWARGRARSIRASSSICSRASGCRRRRSRRCSTRSRDCSASPGSATTCATCWRSSEPAARLAVDYFVYRAAKEIGALAAVLGGHRRRWSSPPASARTPPRSASRICEALGVARHRRSTRRRTTAGRARSRTPDSRVSAWVIPTNEELMIARHTGAVLGLTQAQV